MGVKVHIEYCGGWGYGPRYQELHRAVLAEVPTAEVTGQVGRSSSFEVTVNDKLIFSKLKLGGFPAAEDVIASIREAEKGLEAKEITTAQSPGCSIL